MGNPIFVPDEKDWGGPLIQRETPFWDSVGASFLQSVKQAETSSLIRSINLSLKERDDDITSYKELNKMFPNIDEPFNKDTSLAYAQEINDRYHERRNLERIVANGDPDSTLLKAVSFGASIVPQALDPVGLAMGAFIGAGITKVVSHVARGANVLSTATGRFFFKGGEKGLESTIAKNMTEGLLGNVAGELAFIMPASRKEHADVNTYQNLTNAIIGGLTFPAVVGGAKKAWKFLRGRRGAMEKSMSLAEAQMEKGQLVEVEEFINAERKAALPDLERELEASRNAPDPDVKKIERLEKEIQEVKDMPEPDRQAAMEDANSREKSVHYDAEMDARSKESAVIDNETADMVSYNKKRYDTVVGALDEYKDEWDAEELKQVQDIQSGVNNIEEVDTMMKMAFNCVRN